MKNLILAFVIFITPIVYANSNANAKKLVELTVTEEGFQPNKIDVKAGDDVTLKITRKTENTCATAIKIPAKKIKADLPLNKTVTIEVGKLQKGEIRFSCGMDMITGIINVR
jgi:plastocyanin domain-containing protein